MAVEIVDFPMKNGDFPWQNVSSPEGILHVCFQFDVNVPRIPSSVHNCTDTIPTFRRSSSSTTGGKQPFSPHSKNLQTLRFYQNVDSLGFDHVIVQADA